MERRLRLGLVEQQRVLIDALSFLLKDEPRIQLVCAAETADAGWEAICKDQPNVVVLDGDLPLGHAFDLAGRIRQKFPESRIVFLTRKPTDVLIDQALRVRADGILSRSDSVMDVVEALHRIGGGARTFSPLVEARLEFDAALCEFRLRNNAASQGLTDRQLEILRHLARGESVKSVARKLFLSPKSVDNQKFRIMHKIGVRDKVSLALFAVREGLIDP